MMLEGQSITIGHGDHGNRQPELLRSKYIHRQEAERGNWKWVKSMNSQITTPNKYIFPPMRLMI